MIYCEKKQGKQSAFDRRSFRWIRRGKAKILIACPRGKWNAPTDRCRVGTRAYAVLTPARGGRCKAGRKLRK